VNPSAVVARASNRRVPRSTIVMRQLCGRAFDPPISHPDTIPPLHTTCVDKLTMVPHSRHRVITADGATQQLLARGHNAQNILS
jgi:hypothetical protein